MAEADPTPARSNYGGRPFVCEGRSPDGAWHVQVFGPNCSHGALYVNALHPEHGVWAVPLGRKAVGADRIGFRWDMPNGAWGVFIDGECWALCAHRPAQRMNRTRIFSRSGPHAQPFTAEEIRFLCAKRRGQKPGTRGFIIEE
jgi:hypothetical protein